MKPKLSLAILAACVMLTVQFIIPMTIQASISSKHHVRFSHSLSRSSELSISR